jgi:transcription-repair coupling factor (superfamily II helicase)
MAEATGSVWYLFYPELSVISEIAVKRLKVIFRAYRAGTRNQIAMKDMEIRETAIPRQGQSGQLASSVLTCTSVSHEAIATMMKKG